MGPILAQCLGLPIGLAVCATVVVLWIYLTPVTKSPVVYPVLLLVLVLATCPVHELLHMLAHPQLGMSRKSIIGVWPSRLILYTHYDGELSRNRMIAVLAMPLLVITVVPLTVCAFIGHAPVTVAYVSALNALGTGIDILEIGLLLFQLPYSARLRISGSKVHWKPGKLT
jgi:hypothetical protein